MGFEFLSGLAGSGKTGYFISRVGIGFHYNSISRGVIDSRDLLYFLGAMGIFIMGTRTVMQSNKW
jgi:ABC-2 type transport system permease protein